MEGAEGGFRVDVSKNLMLNRSKQSLLVISPCELVFRDFLALLLWFSRCCGLPNCLDLPQTPEGISNTCPNLQVSSKPSDTFPDSPQRSKLFQFFPAAQTQLTFPSRPAQATLFFPKPRQPPRRFTCMTPTSKRSMSQSLAFTMLVAITVSESGGCKLPVPMNGFNLQTPKVLEGCWEMAIPN